MKYAYFFLALLIAMAISLGFYIFAKSKWSYIGAEDDGSSGLKVARKAEKEAGNKIFFLAPNGRWLKPEKRELPVGGGLEKRVAASLEMLAKGPLDSASFMALPPFRLKHIFVDQSGYAYLNLEGMSPGEIRSGALGEALIIYSIVNTVIFNFPEVKKVRILIDGETKETFAGHMDISKPLGPNFLLAGEWPR